MQIKTDINGVYRDDDNKGALLSKDAAALASYKKQKETNRRIASLEQKIFALETKINQLLADAK